MGDQPKLSIIGLWLGFKPLILNLWYLVWIVYRQCNLIICHENWYLADDDGCAMNSKSCVHFKLNKVFWILKTTFFGSCPLSFFMCCSLMLQLMYVCSTIHLAPAVWSRNVLRCLIGQLQFLQVMAGKMLNST